MMPGIMKGRVPIPHLMSLAIIKTRLCLHWQDVETWYMFITCAFKSAPVAQRLAGNRDVLHYIRDYLWDKKQFSPSARFAVRDNKELERQIVTLLSIVNKLKPGHVKQLLIPDMKTLKPSKKNSASFDAPLETWNMFAHDSRCHAKLKELLSTM
jgi:hypothetical protein